MIRYDYLWGGQIKMNELFYSYDVKQKVKPEVLPLHLLICF